MSSLHSPPSFLLFLLFLLPLTSNAQPPPPTFSYINSGEFGPYTAEYSATYRPIPISTPPFQLCFFNTTPNSFYLALAIGNPRSRSPFRFVWTANPNRSVTEGSSFALRPDGDLRLTDSDGSTVFSSGTAGKGVAAFRLLPNGNIVLANWRGIPLWQSFEHPADTLLAGQTLLADQKLMSRGGKHGLLVFLVGVALFVETNLDGPIVYSTGNEKLTLSGRGIAEAVTFGSAPEAASIYSYDLALEFQPGNQKLILARPKYNATLSFLRVEEDGNLVIHTYYDPVDSGAWEKTFVLFSDEDGWESGCRLPSKCGNLGLCDRDMCVACPAAAGLGGWSDGCRTPARGCEGRGYYRVEGVDLYASRFMGAFVGGKGVRKCFEECLGECWCAGVLHWEREGKCWMVPELLGSPAPGIGTLEKVEDSSHVLWIKK